MIYGKVLLPPTLRTKDKIFVAGDYVRDLKTAYEQVRKLSQEHKKNRRKRLIRNVVL